MADHFELSEIFELDPLSLTKDAPEIAFTIEAFRAMRHKFNMGDIKAGTVKPKAVSKKQAEVTGLDLDIKI